MNQNPINIKNKLNLFSEHWSPKIIAKMNDYEFKIAKIRGDFVWHSHPESDETFIVIDGEMQIDFREGIPEVSTTESETMVGVQDGITVVMAGLIKDDSIKIENKVPFLGNIPILGYLFRSSDYKKLKNEIIIFLTPHITTGEASVDDLEKLDRFENR